MATELIPPFYIGQEVICLKDIGIIGTKYGVQKGKDYVVTAIYKPCCYYVIQVGIIYPGNFISTCCFECNTQRLFNKNIEFNASKFAPKLNQEYKEVTFTKITEEIGVPCEQ